MKQNGNKIYADEGKFLYCKELNRYCTSTTDLSHKWKEVSVRKDRRYAK